MDERRAALAVALAALVGVAAQDLFYRQATGLNVLVATSLFLASIYVARRPGARVRRSDGWMPLTAILFAAACALRTDQALLVLDVLATVVLASGAVVTLGGMVSWSALAGPAALFAAAWPRVRLLRHRRLALAWPYLRGLGLAAPFVVVFAALFASADAVFGKALGELLDPRRIVEALREVPTRTVVAVFAAYVVATAVAALWRAPNIDTGARAWRLIGAEPATVMLATIDLLFAAFVGFQLTYLFGGRDTMDAAAITYSAYARRGFFELIAVACLAGALLFGLELTLRRRGRLYVAAALALLGLTAVVLASAAYRLDLYQRAYGWSELRLYALAGMAFLGGGLAVLAWSVARGRTARALPALAMTATAVALALNVVGPSAFIAGANLERFIDPSGLPEDAERSLDTWYLISLGDGAIPVILERLPALPERERLHLVFLLARERFGRDLFHGPDWRSWNLERELSRWVLAFR